MNAGILDIVEGVLAALRDSPGRRDTLTGVCESLTRTVPCDHVAIYLWSRRRQAFAPVARHGQPAPPAKAARAQDVRDQDFALGTLPGEEKLREGRAVAVGREGASGALAQRLRRFSLQAVVAVPLLVRGRFEGAVTCGTRSPAGFSADQVTRLEEVAPHLATLIQSTRVVGEAGRLADQRAHLLASAAAVLAAADLEETAGQLCAAGRRLFGAGTAALFTLEGDALVSRAREAPEWIPLAVSSPLTEALRTRRVLVVNDLAGSAHAGAPLGPAGPAAALVAAPLMDEAGALGVLAVSDAHDPHCFGPAAEEEARLLAAIATVALRKVMLLAALRRASEAKTDLLATVSHELRTPLSVLLGYGELLSEGTFGALAPEQAEIIGRIMRTATGQLTVLNDIIDLARVEQGKIACDPRRVDVGDLVQGLRETMDALLRDRPVVFEVEVARDAVAWTDPQRLRQVMVNLLANAAKFTESGTVRMVATREGSLVRVLVSDTGPGMDRELRTRALEPFVRGEGTGAGSGLGLAIAARLVTLLGGEIAIDSTPGLGTAVHLRLPAA